MRIEEITPKRTGFVGCRQCGGVGFTLAENVKGSRSQALVLCNCRTDVCVTCPRKGIPPYFFYSEEEDAQVACACYESRNTLKELERLVEIANIPPRYRFQFLHTIEIGDQLNDEEMSFLIAHDWANELVHRWKDSNFDPLGFYLWGGTGSGKTLLACVILNELIFRYGESCKYAKINKDFLSAIKATYQTDSETHGMERSIEREFANVNVLVIDDFGVQKDSDFNTMKLYDLIDTRYEQGKLTLLTSNQPLVDWKDKGHGRIYSRLCEMTKEIELKCSDFRQKRKS